MGEPAKRGLNWPRVAGGAIIISANNSITTNS
jgi:hypothetical protein